MPDTFVPPLKASEVRGSVWSLLAAIRGAKRYAPIPLLMLALLATAALRFEGALEAEGLVFNTVTMPIEVMGPAGHIEAVSIDVTNPSGVDSMYIVGHALGYHNSPGLWDGTIERDEKASYRVNGGAWLLISNANANVRFPESAYMGIGGAFHTIRLTVSVSGIVAGSNLIEFRFNGTEGVGAGYRILELDLLGPGGVSQIGNTTFVQDDPETWTAPEGYESPSDVTAGEQWWTQRNTLIESPLPGSPMIVASCSDCHAYSGFDLKYFNYSNRSIAERSAFHGLTEEQGNQIAAFIRQVELGRTDGRETSPYAAPWNPPYQPGAGLTDRGEEDWAAGAGYETVLGSDDELPAYMFPDVAGNVPNENPSREDMRRAMHVGSFFGSDEQAWGSRLDPQNTSIAIQFPDWNNWLPDIHPLDSFGESDFMGTELWQRHLEMYDRLDTQAERDDEIEEFRDWMTNTGNGATGINEIFSRVDYEFDDFPDNGLYDISYGTEPARFYLGKLSLTAWQSVKTWEVLTTHKLQDLADDIWGGLSTPVPWEDAGNPLRVIGSRTSDDAPFFWPGPQSVIFDMAPHKNGEPGFPAEGAYGPNGTSLLHNYFSTTWYDLQLLLSRGLAGMQSNNGGAPIDNSYQIILLADLESSSGVSNYWRRLRTRAVIVQSHNNYWMMRRTGAGGMGCHCGQHPKESNWYEIFGLSPSSDGSTWAGAGAQDQVLARAATEEFLNELFEFRSTVDPSEWSREGDGYEEASYTPTPYSGGYYFDTFAWADNAYRLPPLLQAWGTRASLINDIAEWGEEMWPLGNWEQWFYSGGNPPETTLIQPTNGEVFTAPALIEMEAEVQQGEASIDRVEFYFDGTLVGTDTSLPYTASVSDVGVGTYELTASAFDTDGLEGPSFPVTVSVTTGTTPPTVTLTQPFNGQVFIAPATILFAADATPGDAPIDRVEFYSGETLIGTDAEPPYTATWTGVQPGTYVLFAKAIDENGAEGESTPVAVTVVEETGENIHFIPLLPGWNMISTYIEPDDPAMASVFAEIIDVVVMVRDGEGNVFIPESGIDDIGPWVMGAGYQVYVTDAATLEIEGIPIEPTTSPIQLGEGWNQIAYLRESPMPISEALATVSDQIVVVKDVFGRIYLPDLEIDQIGDMLPGQGYKVYVSEDCTLLYPPNGSGFNGGPLVAANGRSQSPALRKMKPAGTGILVGSAPPTSFLFGGYAVGNTATLVLQAPDELEGYLVGVRTDENEIVGEAVVWDGMAVLSILGDDTPNPSGSQGASPGDELEVFILGTDGREIANYRIENLLDLLRGLEASTPLTYHEDNLWLASLEAGEEEVGETPGTFELAATNYPNPFTRTTTIAYSLNDTADVEIQVIDVLGRLVATLVAEMQEAGTYQTVFDGSRLASGTYFYRLRANYQVHTGRMTLAR